MLPVGMQFMENFADGREIGHYNTKQHMWLNNGEAALINSASVTGSTCSTGASGESDWNEDYD